MADPAVIGMVSGAVGSVCGIGALIVSIKAYIRVSEIKALDLRLELQKALNELDQLRNGLEEFMRGVNQSRERVMAARGQNRSGAHVIWTRAFDADIITARRLLEIAPRLTGGYEKMSTADLEILLVQVHRSMLDIRGMREKYQAAMRADDEWRRMREQQMNPPRT